MSDSRVTHTDTNSTPFCSPLGNENACPHCSASYGHTILCPLINRDIAEARSAELSRGDVERLHALGVSY